MICSLIDPGIGGAGDHAPLSGGWRTGSAWIVIISQKNTSQSIIKGADTSMRLKEFDLTLDIKKATQVPYFEVVAGDYEANVLNISLVDSGTDYLLDGLDKAGE